MTTKPIGWPTDDHEWWWMRYRPSPRSKWRVVLISTRIVDGTKWIKPHGDRDCLSHHICRYWEAMFVPAEPPPEGWR